jgi:hypothetical protein
MFTGVTSHVLLLSWLQFTMTTIIISVTAVYVYKPSLEYGNMNI